jgi:ketosteroid isomerase-like protein
MRKSILATLLFMICGITLNAQTAPDAAELTKMLNEFLAGAGRNDAAVHDRFWADDLIYTRSAGVRTNKEEIMKGLRSSTPRKEGDPVTVYTAEEVKIQQYGNAAVVAFRLISTTTKGDGTKTVGNNLNTGTFIKRDGKWQVVAWQSTIVPEPKATSSQPAAQTAPTAPTAVSDSTKTEKADTPTGARTYLKGPRGGCYYVNAAGKNVYVNQSYCK